MIIVEGKIKMKLYNITFNLKDTRKILESAIPDSAGTVENKTIKRVCLTDSIEHCMQAIAVGNRYIANGAKFIVREVNIPKNANALIHPNQLYKNNLVPDALENNEFWYLHSIKCKTYLCEIIHFDFEHDLAFSCIQANDARLIINKYVPELKLGRYKNSKNMYDAFCNYVNKHCLWNEFDSVWDDLAELPWAQTTKITGLQYKIISKLV